MLKTYSWPRYATRRAPEIGQAGVRRVPLVVVGAGPVGLSAAIDAALHGLPVVLLDDDDTVSVGSRGVCYAKRTLEIFDRLGVGDAVVGKGVTWNVGRTFHRDSEVFAFNLRPEDGHQRPGMVNLQQYHLEQFLVDMALGKDYVGPLLDEVADYSAGIGRALIDAGAVALLTGDDLGMEIGPMISPRMWRQWLKPRLQRVLDAYRAARADVILAYHTCGSVLPFIDELIEVGVQVLNTIQVTAHGMDAAWLKRTYGSRLAFCGGVDQRHVLPHGSTADVEAEVRRRIGELGPGGYVLAPTHDIQADTPVENVLAVFEAARRWGAVSPAVVQPG